MKRRPEPELMDSTAQTLAYAGADFSEANSLFVDHFMEAFPALPASGHLVDLGCGPADICIRLSRRLPGWRITGLDAGENMLRRATEALLEAGKNEIISLALSRLPDSGLDRRAFDAVVSNSLLHHLPEPATLWDTILKTGKPGAAVTVMDLRRPESEAAAISLVDHYAADAPPVLQEDFFNSLLAAYTPEEVELQLGRSGLGQLQVTLPSDRHWIVTGTVPGKT
jgi:2-polyprenyl-3-methyl-5-hydroxy-6-metoxy-1,4-benzoquinol methylase